jgi:hypothetical protein
MTRRSSALFILGLLAPSAVLAGGPAVHLDLRFKGCAPEEPVISVLFPDGETRDARLTDAGERWRITLDAAVDPEGTELAPQLEDEGFEVKPTPGKYAEGTGAYAFKCWRLKTLVVQSEPYDPPLRFRYEINRPERSGNLDTSDSALPIHPYGGITIWPKEGDCEYELAQVNVSSLSDAEGQRIRYPLLQSWALHCRGKEPSIFGFDMATPAAQITRARAKRSQDARDRPDHDWLILFLDGRGDG